MSKLLRPGAQALLLAILAGSASALGASGGDDEFNFGKPEVPRWRMGFSFGTATPNDVDPTVGNSVIEYSSGYLVAGTLGYHVSSLSERMDFGLELEGLATQSDIDSEGALGTGSPTGDNTSTVAGLVNGVFDWQLSPRVTLSVAAGVGYAVIDLDPLKAQATPYKLDGGQDSSFAAQGKVGLVYDMGGGFSWSLGYRYFRTDDVDASNGVQTFDFSNEVQSFELGVRFDL